MRKWAKWTLRVAAVVVGVVAFRFGVAFLRGDAAVALPPVATHGADAFGDPLPEGAVARIGTIRWRARGPAVWAPDGEHLIVGGWDDELLAMNVRTGLVDWTMPGHAGKLALNIDVRDLPRIVQTGELPTATDSLRAMALMPDGHRLLTAGHSLRVWDLDARAEVQRIPIHSEAWPVAVSPDGKLAASPWNGNFIRVIELEGGTRRARIDVGSYASCVSFDRDGSRVLAGFPDGRVAIARVAGGDPVFVKVSDGWIGQILVPGNGHAFWAVDMRGVVTIRSLETPDVPVRRIERTRAEADGYPAGMVASPDGRIVAVSWGGGDPIRWLDATTAEPVAGPTSEPGLHAIGWSPDGKLFAAWQGRVIHIFGKGAPVAPDAAAWQVDDVAFSPDGRSIATRDGTLLRIADAATGRLQTKFDTGGWGTSLAWTRDGTAVVVGSRGRRVIAFDAATGRQTWTFQGDPSATSLASSAEVGPDASAAWWNDADGSMHVVDLRSDARTVTIMPIDAKSPTRGTYGAAATVDARRIAVLQDMPRAGSQNPSEAQLTLRAWNVGSTAPFAEVFVRRSGGLALSCDGRFATAGDMTSLGVIDLDASPPREIGRVQWTIRDRDSWHGPWTSVAFSPDATRLAVGDVDGVVHLFALPSCAEFATFRGHRAGIACVAFSDDGTRLVSGSADMTALVWDVSKLPAPPAIPAAK